MSEIDCAWTSDAVAPQTRTKILQILGMRPAGIWALSRSLDVIALDPSRAKHRTLKVEVEKDVYVFTLDDDVSVVMRQARHPKTEVRMMRGCPANISLRPASAEQTVA